MSLVLIHPFKWRVNPVERNPLFKALYVICQRVLEQVTTQCIWTCISIYIYIHIHTFISYTSLDRLPNRYGHPLRRSLVWLLKLPHVWGYSSNQTWSTTWLLMVIACSQRRSRCLACYHNPNNSHGINPHTCQGEISWIMLNLPYFIIFHASLSSFPSVSSVSWWSPELPQVFFLQLPRIAEAPTPRTLDQPRCPARKFHVAQRPLRRDDVEWILAPYGAAQRWITDKEKGGRKTCEMPRERADLDLFRGIDDFCWYELKLMYFTGWILSGL